MNQFFTSIREDELLSSGSLYISMTTTAHLLVFAKAMKRLIASSLLLMALMSLTACRTTHHQPSVEFKKVIHLGKNGNIEPVLNELGKEGWHVVGYQVFTGDGNVGLL